MEINRTAKTLTISQNTGITFSVAFLIMLAGALITGTTWISSMQSRTEALEKSSIESKADIAKLKNESTQTQIKFTEIQTQLKSIDTTLLEIKEKLK